MTSETPKKTQLRAGLVPGDRSWSVEPSRKEPQTSTTSQPPSHHQIFWGFLSFWTNRCFMWQSFWGCGTWFFLTPRNLSRCQNHEKLMVPLRPYQSKPSKPSNLDHVPLWRLQLRISSLCSLEARQRWENQRCSNWALLGFRRSMQRRCAIPFYHGDLIRPRRWHPQKWCLGFWKVYQPPVV